MTLWASLPLRLSFHTTSFFFFAICHQDQTDAVCRPSPRQVSSPLQHKQSRQSETIDIFQKEGLCSCRGGIQVAPQNHTCSLCPWPRHGQQRKWADVLWGSAGQLRAPSSLCGRLKDGRGQRQVQRLYPGASRAETALCICARTHVSFFFIRLNLNSCVTQGECPLCVFLTVIKGSRSFDSCPFRKKPSIKSSTDPVAKECQWICGLPC